MSLRTEIIFIFLGIMLTAITIAGTVFYYSSRNLLLEEIYRHLESIAEAKKQRVNNIVSVREEQISLLQSRELAPLYLNNYLITGSEEDLRLLNHTASQINSFINSFKVVHIIDLNGFIIASSDTSYIGKDYSQNESFQEALEGKKAISAFHYDDEGRFIIDMAGLIHLQQMPKGVLMAETYADELLSVVMDFHGLGETGETTIMKADEDGNAVYVTPTRHFPVKGVYMQVKRDDRYEIFKALDKEEGLHTDLYDYREEPVIAATRYINGLDWGLTTKIDIKEAYGPIVSLRNKMFFITLMFCAFTGIVAYYFADYVIRPFRQISLAAKKIAEGDYSQNIQVERQNEVGEMAYLFNKMTDKLVNARHKLNVKIDALNASNESLKRFSYVVSHDLKSPLNNFSGLLSMLQKKYVDINDKQFNELVVMMVNKSKHMKNLIDGILNYSRAGTGEASWVDLNEVLDEVIEIIDIPSSLKLDIENLPKVYIDKVAVSQVFMNLMSNSVKFMDKEEGLVHVRSEDEGDYHKICFSDNGPGIAKKNYKKVFEIFNKVNTNPDIDSSGIGLSIVKKIIEVNGGRIWLESEKGKWTTFYFLIPKK